MNSPLFQHLCWLLADCVLRLAARSSQKGSNCQSIKGRINDILAVQVELSQTCRPAHHTLQHYLHVKSVIIRFADVNAVLRHNRSKTRCRECHQMLIWQIEFPSRQAFRHSATTLSMTGIHLIANPSITQKHVSWLQGTMVIQVYWFHLFIASPHRFEGRSSCTVKLPPEAPAPCQCTEWSLRCGSTCKTSAWGKASKQVCVSNFNILQVTCIYFFPLPKTCLHPNLSGYQ